MENDCGCRSYHSLTWMWCSRAQLGVDLTAEVKAAAIRLPSVRMKIPTWQTADLQFRVYTMFILCNRPVFLRAAKNCGHGRVFFKCLKICLYIFCCLLAFIFVAKKAFYFIPWQLSNLLSKKETIIHLASPICHRNDNNYCLFYYKIGLMMYSCCDIQEGPFDTVK